MPASPVNRRTSQEPRAHRGAPAPVVPTRQPRVTHSPDSFVRGSSSRSPQSSAGLPPTNGRVVPLKSLLPSSTAAAKPAPQVNKANVERARKEIEKGFKGPNGTVTAARLLEKNAGAMKNPAEVDQLMTELKPTLDAMSADANKHKSNRAKVRAVYDSFTTTAERASPAGVKTLARSLTRTFPDGNLEEIDDALGARVRGGGSPKLSLQLATELEAAKKSRGASDVKQAVSGAVSDLRGTFEDAKARKGELDKQLADLQTYNALLTPEQQKKALGDFLRRHQKDFDAYERAARNLAPSVAAIGEFTAGGPTYGQGRAAGVQTNPLYAEGLELARLVPSMAGTKAGDAVIAQAVKDKGAGQRTFLDAVDRLETTLTQKDSHYREELKVAVLSACSAAVSFEPDNVERVFNGLTNCSHLLEMQQGEVDQLVGSMRQLRSARNAAEAGTAARQLADQIAEFKSLGETSSTGKAFKGLATAVAVFSMGNDLKELSAQDLTGKAQTIVDTLETTNDLVDLLGKSSMVEKLSAKAGTLGTLGSKISAAGEIAGKISTPIAVVSAVLEGVQAGQAFSQGHYMDGAGHVASGVGTLVMAGAALASSGAGAVVGGALIALGMGLSQWSHVNEANKNEGPSREYLKAAGLSDKLATQLSNHTGNGYPPAPVLAALAKKLHLSGPELLRRMENLSSDELRNVIENGVHAVKITDAGNVHVHDADDARSVQEQFERLRRAWGPNIDGGRVDVESVDGLAVWLKEQRLVA